MSVIQKKVCMLGSFAVGKTSLVRQYVDSTFFDNYVTTIGVKIDKKNMQIGDQGLSLVLWDVYGEDNHQSVLPAYLRGLAGYILVVDPTRPSTLTRARALHAMVEENLGPQPFVLALNKADIKDQWVQELDELHDLQQRSLATIETSAKLDIGVSALFDALSMALLSTEEREQ